MKKLNLTKGKIPKLLKNQKHKQSLKKRKNRKSSYKRNTFRHNRGLNLHNKTLKRINYRNLKTKLLKPEP